MSIEVKGILLPVGNFALLKACSDRWKPRNPRIG